jgi:hypothetical protein
MLVGLLSYGVLAAAILKAREISPNRAALQPSIVLGNFSGMWPQQTAAPAAPSAPQPVPAVAYAVASAEVHAIPSLPPPRIEVLPPAPPELPTGTLSLRIGARYLVIVVGLRILEHQAQGLHPASPGGPVAEVTRNPRDPDVLGLTNLSTSNWEVVSPNGNRRQIATGQTARLSAGTRIDFGEIDGEVR